MSWMAEMASYRHLGELRRRYRDVDLEPHSFPAGDEASSSERTDAAGARSPAGDDDARRSGEPAASVNRLR